MANTIACAVCSSEPQKNITLSQEAKKLMEEKFKTGTNKWFFSKLRF